MSGKNGNIVVAEVNSRPSGEIYEFKVCDAPSVESEDMSIDVVREAILKLIECEREAGRFPTGEGPFDPNKEIWFDYAGLHCDLPFTESEPGELADGEPRFLFEASMVLRLQESHSRSD